MTIQAKDLISLMNEWAPPELAEAWDHPGLQAGDLETPVTKVMTALDLTEENVDRAAAEGVSMIISHHPFLFKPLHAIDLSTYKGRVIAKLIRHNIVSFAAHTNLDTAEGGVNDALATALGLTDLTGLVPEKADRMMKLVAYVTPIQARTFHFYVKKKYPDGVKQYYLLDDNDDFTDNAKMEMSVQESVLPAVVADLKEHCGGVEYDVYVLKSGAHHHFMGRIGSLPHPMKGREALSYIKEKLGIPNLRYAGHADSTVKRVAVLGGAGSEFAPLAKAKGADLYLTGDLKYHEAQDAARLPLLIADGGHFYTERVIVPALAARIRKEAEKRGWNLEVLEDSGAEDIFHHV